jgi:glycerol-3-phosphate O-acyltransferase
VSDEAQRRTAVATLGHKIVYGINRSGVVTSTSLVVASLFGFRKKGLDEEVLLVGAHNLVRHLQNKPAGSVRFSPDETMNDETLRAALARLVDDELVVRAQAGERVLYQMAPDATFPLDTFKNQLLHHVVPEAIVATAFHAAGGKPGVPVSRSVLAETARALSRALKIEFIFKPGVTFDQLFVDAVKNAIAAGFVEAIGPDLVVPDRDDARGARRFAASLIANFVEAYFFSLAALPRLAGKDDKALVLALLETLKAHALAGELKCAEAPSKAIVENVVALAKDLGILKDGAIADNKRLNELTDLLKRSAP